MKIKMILMMKGTMKKIQNNISEEEKLEISPEEKIEELEDKLLRTVAEMDNMRKRSDKERSEAYKIGRLYSSKICYQ